MVGYPGLNSNPYVAGFSAESPYAELYLPTLGNFGQVDTSVFAPAIQRAERGASVSSVLSAASVQLNGLVGCKS
jgi:hypothetical protein